MPIHMSVRTHVKTRAYTLHMSERVQHAELFLADTCPSMSSTLSSSMRGAAICRPTRSWCKK